MKYIKTLLVDDDYLVLMDLKNIVNWKELGFQITGTASNGKSALSIVEKESPDLIVTDISMPVMDGFDFIKIIQEKYPDIYIIFISSYADFDYAKRAMKAGIRDYLIKNEITSEALSDQLLQVKEFLQNRTRNRVQDYRLKLSEYFMSGSIQPLPEELHRKRFIFYFISYYQPLEKLKPHFQRTVQGGSDLYHRLHDIYFDSYPDALLFTTEDILIAGIPAKSFESCCSITGISNTAKTLRSWFAVPDNCDLFVSYYPYKLSLEACRSFYQKLLPLIRFQNSFPVAFQENLAKLEESVYIPVRQNFSYKLLASSLDHPEELYNQLDYYAGKLFEQKDIDGIFYLYHNCMLQMEELSEHMLNFSSCQYFHDQETFLNFIKKSYEEVRQSLQISRLKHYSIPLSTAMEYMKHNYQNHSLTVEIIAAQIGFSSSRFSVLFKQETGQTVGDYLTDLRISQAIHLLENSHLKIYEIAEHVGYKSAQYFSQVFYQRTGHKPLYFRQKKPE